VSQLLWVLERATGITALVLLVISTVWGLLLSTRVLGPRMRSRDLLADHRFLSSLAVVFTAAHVLGALVQRHVDVGVRGALIPFASAWEPLAMALGTIAAYLLAAVYVTSLARARIGPRAWRAIHHAGFALFWVAALHTLLAGTDASAPLLRWGVVAAMAVVSALVLVRVAAPRGARTAGVRRPGRPVDA
jgi:predicted ferric reductase